MSFRHADWMIGEVARENLTCKRCNVKRHLLFIIPEHIQESLYDTSSLTRSSSQFGGIIGPSYRIQNRTTDEWSSGHFTYRKGFGYSKKKWQLTWRADNCAFSQENNATKRKDNNHILKVSRQTASRIWYSRFPSRLLASTMIYFGHPGGLIRDGVYERARQK